MRIIYRTILSCGVLVYLLVLIVLVGSVAFRGCISLIQAQEDNGSRICNTKNCS
jgi:hypothetical protein